MVNNERKQMKILVFTMKTCNPCKTMKVELEQKGLTSNITFIDAQDNLELTKQYNIRSVPTTIMLSDTGELISRISGSIQLTEIQKALDTEGNYK